MTDFEQATIPEEHHELLTTQHIGMLTTLRTDGMFSTNPVGFVWDGETIRFPNQSISTKAVWRKV